MAEVSRSTLLGTIATNLPDNTSAQISPADLRGELVNQADSVPFRVTQKTAPPGVNDDNTGTGGNGTFGVGDFWIDETNDIAYVAIDVTTTAAVWEAIGGGLVVTKSGTPVNDQIAIWINDTEIEGTSALTFEAAGLLKVSANTPIIEVEDDDGAADNQRWQLRGEVGALRVNAATDAGALGTNYAQFTRTGNQIDGLEFTTSGATRTTIASNSILMSDAISYVGTDSAHNLILQTNSTDKFTIFNASNTATFTSSAGNATTLHVGDSNATTGTNRLTLGNGRTDNGSARVDLITDTTYTTYGARFNRASGENGITSILHRGTGILRFNTEDMGDYQFQVAGTNAVTIDSATLDVDMAGSLTTAGDITATTTAPSLTLTSTDTADYTITSVTQANPAVVTVTDTTGLTNGDSVSIAGVVGMTELNGNTYEILVLGGTSFSLVDTDSTGYSAYTSDGTTTKEALSVNTSVIDTGSPFGPTSLFGTDSYHDIRFKTNSAARMVIDRNGQVGIGTNTPIDALLFLNAESPRLRLNDTGASNVGDIETDSEVMRFSIDSGNVVANSRFVWEIDGTEVASLSDNGLVHVQPQSEETTIFRRVRPTESGYSYEMNNAAANTLEILGDKDFTITGATQANPCVITVADTTELETGDTGDIASVVGMTELNGAGPYTITVIDGTTFSLDGVDSTGYTAYTSGGTFTRDGLVYPEGFYFEVIQAGAGTTTVQGGSGVDVNGTVAIPGTAGGDITAQFDVVRARKLSTGGWIFDGDIGAIS